MSTKGPYIQKLKAEFDELNAEIDLFEAKARQAQTGAKIKYEEHIAELRQKREELRQRFERLGHAGGDIQEEFKQGAEKMWDSLKELFARTKREFEHGYREGSEE